MTYLEFVASKQVRLLRSGVSEPDLPSPVLFDFQQFVTIDALKRGRSALFLDTGLGKTLCQLEWARQVPGDVLILAPLAVAQQTVREASEKLNLSVGHSKDGTISERITIANYERLHLFEPSRFNAIVLDESSILKSFEGKTKRALCEGFKATPFKLCCTATPAPNDYTELGNHSEFLNVMRQSDMQSRWFVNDSSDTGTWRLKGHAVRPFWEWVASWGACVERPSDAGGDDTRFRLPKMTTNTHVVGEGFRLSSDEIDGVSATSMFATKRESLADRVSTAAALAKHDQPCIVWCQTNEESTALRRAIPDSIEVKGSDPIDEKESKLVAFSTGQERCIITKDSIAGFGLNWQHCAHQVFASISYSYEAFYQAVRRSWRFGQTRPVTIDVVLSQAEQPIWNTLKQKLAAHDQMKSAMRFAKPILQTPTSNSVPQMTPGHLPRWLSR